MIIHQPKQSKKKNTSGSFKTKIEKWRRREHTWRRFRWKEQRRNTTRSGRARTISSLTPSAPHQKCHRPRGRIWLSRIHEELELHMGYSNTISYIFSIYIYICMLLFMKWFSLFVIISIYIYLCYYLWSDLVYLS